MRVSLKLLTFSYMLLLHTLSFSQARTTIEECYKMAVQNYPLSKERDLIDKSRELSVNRVISEYFPHITIVGDAVYQSDVINIGLNIPGIDIQPPKKSQFKIVGELQQSIFDGGYLRNKKRIAEGDAAIEDAELSVNMYKLRQRITDLYFGILMIEQRLKQNNSLRADLQIARSSIQAAVAQGTSLRSNLSVIDVALLQAEQREIELLSSRKSYIEMLNLFVGEKFTDQTLFVMPNIITSQKEINRPELKLFENQQDNLLNQRRLLKSLSLPKIALFLQGGVGRPGLNMFSPDTSPFFIGGVRLTIPITDLYIHRNDRKKLDLNISKITINRECFLLNLAMELRKEEIEIDKLNKLIHSDIKIVELRDSVTKAALSQFENGIINAGDYMREVNAGDIAKQNRILHEVELLMRQYNCNILRGIGID